MIISKYLNKIIAVFFSLALIAAAESELTDISIPIPSCGNLKVGLPGNWNPLLSEDKNAPLPTFKISVEDNSGFLILVSPGSPCGMSFVKHQIKNSLEDELKSLIAFSDDKKVKICDLSTKDNRIAYYFTLSDKNPAPGEYKMVIRLLFVIQKVLISTTVLYNDPKSSKVATVLEAFGVSKLANRTMSTRQPIDTIYYSGKDIIDDKGGFCVMGQRSDNVIAVTNLPHHYGLILPYAEDWKFWIPPSTLISGSSQQVSFSITQIVTENSDSIYLEIMKQNLLHSGANNGLKDAQIVECKGIPVLKIRSDVVQTNDNQRFTQFSYYSVKRTSSLVYVFHISQLLNSECTSWDGDDAFIRYAAVGFQADFGK